MEGVVGQGRPYPPRQERVPLAEGGKEGLPKPAGLTTKRVKAIRVVQRGAVDRQVRGIAVKTGASFSELASAARSGNPAEVAKAQAGAAERLARLQAQAGELGADVGALIEVARDSGVDVPAIRGIGERASGGPQRGEFSAVGANPSGSQRLRPLKSFAGWEEHFVSGQPSALRRAFEQSASAAPVVERAAEEPLRSSAAPQEWEEKFMAGAPAALQWEFEEVRQGSPGAPVTAEVSAEAVAETRRFAAMNIQNQLIRGFIQDKTGGRAPQAGSAEAEALAAQWIERYAADFRERVVPDLEVVNAIDEGQINDAARLSAELLYAQKDEAPAGGLTSSSIHDKIKHMQEQSPEIRATALRQVMDKADNEVRTIESELRTARLKISALKIRMQENPKEIDALNPELQGLVQSQKDLERKLASAQEDLDVARDDVQRMEVLISSPPGQ